MVFFSLLQLAIDYHRAKSDMRQRRASESDSILDKEESTPKNVDILQMLSKAQHEYDRVTPNIIEILTGVEGNSWSVGPACKLLPSALGNSLWAGPTDQLLPSTPVNNCILLPSA